MKHYNGYKIWKKGNCLIAAPDRTMVYSVEIGDGQTLDEAFKKLKNKLIAHYESYNF
jgi:hypothetical protein